MTGHHHSRVGAEEIVRRLRRRMTETVLPAIEMTHRSRAGATDPRRRTDNDADEADPCPMGSRKTVSAP
jgi:hypothetical protein